jgi:hypothetical protein
MAQITPPKKSVTLAQGAGVAAAIVTFFVTFMFYPGLDGGPSKGASMVSLGVGFLVWIGIDTARVAAARPKRTSPAGERPADGA